MTEQFLLLDPAGREGPDHYTSQCQENYSVPAVLCPKFGSILSISRPHFFPRKYLERN